jgi:hypothetical protein
MPLGSAAHRALRLDFGQTPWATDLDISMLQRRSLLALLGFILGMGACDSSGPTADLGRLPDTTTTDTTPPPPPPDTTIPPPVDTVPPGPPPDTTGPDLPPYDPTFVGIPFGPAQQPPETFGPPFNGTILPGTPEKLVADLEKARRADTRVLVNLTGRETNIRDANGFSMTLWKQRVDRYRHLNLDRYIDEGTLIGHFLMDEPSDPHNWNGHQVSHEQIDEMARYSKEIWPKLPAIIRAWPDYLQGYQYKYLDAVRVHYLTRLGDIDEFIHEMVQGAAGLNLALIGGLNVMNGGGKDSGIPGRKEGKFGMSAAEVREFGAKFLSEPSLCAFFMYDYDPPYFSRPDITAAVAELKEKALQYPKKACRK